MVQLFLKKDKLMIFNQQQAKVDLKMSKVIMAHIQSCKREIYKHKIPKWKMALLLILMKMKCNWEVQVNLMALVIIKVDIQQLRKKKKTLVSKRMIPLQTILIKILMNLKMLKKL